MVLPLQEPLIGHAASSASPLPFKIPSSIELIAHPGTDIWRKPPHRDIFNGPFLYRSLPLSTFRRARVTVRGDWNTLYDQGGLCLDLPQGTQDKGKRKWIKTGVEAYGGRPNIGTVACDRWADWSLVPMTDPASELTVEMEREVVDGKPTSSLWVRGREGEQDQSVAVREVTWAFEDLCEGDCWVGVYAARPTKDGDDAEKVLKVQFKDLVIDTF